jgi:hypothetical protein
MMAPLDLRGHRAQLLRSSIWVVECEDVSEEAKPFGWEVVERDGGEWMRKQLRSYTAEFRVDGYSKPWHVIDNANNAVVLTGASTLSILRMCRVLEAVIGVLLHKSTSEIPIQ